MSVSTADLELLTEGKNCKSNNNPQGRTVKPSVERQKKHRRELAFFCAFSRLPQRGTPAGTILYFHTFIKSFLESLEPFFHKRF